MTVNEVDLSIIIPTYNRAYVVGRAIQSVLNQTYKNFEILVVDDGSTDNTNEIVRSVNDERVRYIRHEKNKGAAAARNTGIMAAKGKYIAFQDSDDEWLPEKLEKQMAAFRNASSQIGVVYTGMLRIEGDGKTYMPPPEVTEKEGNIYHSLLRRSFVFTSSTVVRRECFTEVGIFDEHFPHAEDWDLWIRISKYYHFRFIDEPLLIYYVMPDSLFVNQACTIRAYEMILEKHYKDIEKDKRILARFYIVMGDLLCSEKKLRQGRRYFMKAAVAYPLNIESLLAYLASLQGQSGYNRGATIYRKIRGWWFSRRR